MRECIVSRTHSRLIKDNMEQHNKERQEKAKNFKWLT